MVNEKKLIVNGINICYAEVNGERDETLFFLHGNSSNSQTWKYQFGNKKLEKYRIIAFDLPAHGKSGIMPDYTLPAIGKIMIEAINLLSNGKPYILVGVSLGTNIIAEMLAYNIHPVAIVLAGPCIIGSKCKIEDIAIPNTAIGVSFVDNPSIDDMQKFTQLICIKLSVDFRKQLITEYQSVKDNFRSRLGRSISDGDYSDQLALIAERNIPALIIFGAEDAAIYPDYLDGIVLPLWKDKIIKLENAGHWVHLDQPEIFSELLKDLSLSVFK